MTYHHHCLSALQLLLCCLALLTGCSDDKQQTKSTTTTPTATSTSPRPALELITGDGNLGTADFGDQRTVTYRIRNNMQQPIALKLLDKSCTCTGVQLPDAPIAPGQEDVVTMNWSPKVDAMERKTIRLWAKVGDAAREERLVLEANGIIEPKVMVAFPRGPLDFGKLTPADLDQDRSKLVAEVYTQQSSFPQPVCKVNLPGVEVLQIEPLTSDRLTTLKAGAGYRLTLRANKQLPHGAFVAPLSIKTTLKKMPLLLDVTGSLETSIVGISPEKFSLPPRLSLKEGYRVPSVMLTIRYGTCKSCEIDEVAPKLFDAKVVQVNEKTWRIELTLTKETEALQKRFTPDAWLHLMQYGFDQGSVTLKLDHPEVKSLTIPITGAELGRE
jgi:hypothetical protein